MAAAFGGKRQGAFISSTSIDLLRRTLTPERWEMLSAITGQGEITVRKIAGRLGRGAGGLKATYGPLLNAGVLDRTDDDRVVFRCDAEHVDFTLTRAA